MPTAAGDSTTARVARRVRCRAGRPPVPPRAVCGRPHREDGGRLSHGADDDCGALDKARGRVARRERRAPAPLAAPPPLRQPRAPPRRRPRLRRPRGGLVEARVRSAWPDDAARTGSGSLGSPRQRSWPAPCSNTAGCGKAARAFQPSTCRSRPHRSLPHASCSGAARRRCSSSPDALPTMSTSHRPPTARGRTSSSVRS